jgi:hypothetical protein
MGAVDGILALALRDQNGTPSGGMIVGNEFRAKKHGTRRMFAFVSCTRKPISTKEKKPKKLNVTLTDHFSKYEFTRSIFSSRCPRIKSCPGCIHENQRWNAL